MIPEKFKVYSEKPVIEAMRKIDVGGIGIVFVVDERDFLLGTISDGDIRKAILAGIDVNEQKIKEIMRQDPIILYNKDLRDERLVNIAGRSLFERNPRGGFVPILDEERRILDLLHISGFIKNNYSDVEKKQNGEEFRKYVNKVLVVGGGGYLGSVLVRKLLSKGYQTRVLETFLYGNHSLKDLEDDPKLELINGDVRDITTISDALKGTDAVIHLAAIVGDPAAKSKPLDTIETNYLATKILAEACKYHQINRFIFASTCSVYGKCDGAATEDTSLNPQSLYAKSKIKSEEGILGLTDKNFSPSILRMATLYGLSPRMRFDLVVNTMTMKAMTEGKITVFGGEQWRPFLHIENAAEAYLKCLESPIEKIKGQVFNVGSDSQNYQIFRLGELVKRIIPKTEIEVVNKEYPEDGVDKRDYNVSFKKIKNILNFEPRKNLEDGILEIKMAIENGLIKDFRNRIYYNHLD